MRRLTAFSGVADPHRTTAYAEAARGDEGMTRFDCLKAIADKVGDALVVCSAGGATTEWYHLRPSDGNFRSRTLGLVSSIGLGLALALPRRKVIVLDGDGSALMNLCGLPTAALAAPGNLIHIVFDNRVYESSGASITATAGPTDLVAVARAAGFPRAAWANTVAEFSRGVTEALAGNQLTFIGVRVELGRPPALPSITIDDTENKYRFVRHIERLEGRDIFGTSYPDA
jgi:thiamine pyrophosphate-dependent acetolactate synthase large subunit-like protein